MPNTQNNPYLIDEADIPKNWEPIEAEPTIPGAAAAAMAATPSMPPYYRGSIDSNLEHDAQFVATDRTPRVTSIPLMPIAPSGNPQNNAAIESIIKISQSTTPSTVTNLAFKGTWTSFTPYVIGNIVIYNGSSYIAITASTNLVPWANPTNWTLLGKNLNFRGDWMAIQTVRQNAPVNYTVNGSPTSVTFSSNLLAGSHILVNTFAKNIGASTVPVVSDSQGNSYTLVVAGSRFDSNEYQMQTWIASAKAGPCIVTVTWTGGTTPGTGGVLATEITNLTASPVGASTHAEEKTGGALPMTLSVSAGQMIYTCATVDGSPLAAPSGYGSFTDGGNETSSAWFTSPAAGSNTVTWASTVTRFMATAVALTLGATTFNYNPYDVVKFQGAMWLCVASTNGSPASDPTSWIFFAGAVTGAIFIGGLISVSAPDSNGILDFTVEGVPGGIPYFAQTEFTPTNFSFSVTHTDNPGNVYPSSLVQFTDPFTSSASLTTLGTPGTVTVTGGTATIANVGAKNTILTETSSSFAMPQAFVAIQVNSITSTATSFDIFNVGLIKDANNYVAAGYDNLNNIIRIQATIGGVSTFFGSVTHTFTAPFKMALGLVGNQATLWADTGSGWTEMVTASVLSVYDFTTVGNLTGWKAGWVLANGGGNSTWVFSNFSAGSFGTVFTRDMTLVVNKDGSPYNASSGVVTLSATCGDTVDSAYCGIFQYNLSSNTLTQTGVIMVQRGGHIYGDLNAAVVVDGSTYRVLMATWGNGFGGAINIEYESTSVNILSGANVLSSMSNLTLPGVTGMGYVNPGSYDPMFVFDSANNFWLIAYVITKDTAFSGSPFFAAAASSPDLTTWTLIGADTANLGWEGAKIIPNNGTYYIAVGGPAGSGNSSRVYNEYMVFQGSLNATFSGGSDTNPHPMVFGVGSTEYLITFDNHAYGTSGQTWGNWIVETATRYASSLATSWASSATLTADAVVVGGGANATPFTIPVDNNPAHVLFATAGAPAFGPIPQAADYYVLGQQDTANLPNSVANPTVYYGVDAQPASAGTLDDEFNGGSLNLSRWTWVNQGTASAVVSNSLLTLTDSSPATTNGLRCLYQATPATPWIVIAKMPGLAPVTANNQGGLFVSDGTKFVLLTVFSSAVNAYSLTIQEWSNSTTFASQPTVFAIASAPQYLSIKDDGTNLIFYVSYDGLNWWNIYQQARLTYLASVSRVGVYANPSYTTGAGSSTTPRLANSFCSFDYFRRTL